MTRKLTEWQERAVASLDALPQHVFTRQQLSDLLSQKSLDLKTPPTLSTARFIQALIDHGKLREVDIPSEPVVRQKKRGARANSAHDNALLLASSYRPFHRYVWGEPSPNEVALSLRKGSYLSHASAVFLHGLTSQIPRTVYANKEQTPKPVPKSSLIQERIDNAFQAEPRQTQYVFRYRETRLVLLNGKHTGDLEVSEVADAQGTVLRTTKLERTLIDITVRPTYAGGVFDVLDAYKGARERASISVLLATLKKIEYVYPYHQAIGFYLERAGYPPRALDRFASQGTNFDFYLTHKMVKPLYDNRWRIYYPEGL